jgi:trehalose synthase
MLETVTEAPPAISPERLEPFVSNERDLIEIRREQDRARELLAGRALVHVSSNMRAGGLAALLRSQVGYARGVGIDARWELIDDTAEFLRLTKHIHNKLQGQPDGGPLGREMRSLYEGGRQITARQLAERLSPGDVVVLHDPHAVGLAGAIKEAGARVIWRCHIGLDAPNDDARQAWSFLEPYVTMADAYVFTRPQFFWEGLDPGRSFAIPSVLNPLSPKNQDLRARTVSGILAITGLQPDGRDSTFVRLDGTPGRVDRRVGVAGGPQLPPNARVVLQVSAWNRLKDPAGVVQVFADFVAGEPNAHLIVAGPDNDSVPDETEAQTVYAETVTCVNELTPAIRERVHVVSVPNDDPAEGAAIVNALQRRATVVVQHSRGEGLGLAVLEALWKQRPVVCSRVGALQEQVADGITGFLVPPGDAPAVGEAIRSLLRDPATARTMGAAGYEHVAGHFLLPHDFPRWSRVLEYVLRQDGQRHPV